jgi:hypothetical protein
MKTISKTLTSAACLALLSICTPQRLHADPRPSAVTVINTPDNPVPVNVQNLVSVPSSITVINTPDNPVPVTVQDEIATRSADNPAFQPYFRQDQSTSSDIGNTTHHYDVPPGKRLVIEYIGARAITNETSKKVEISVSVLKPGGTYTRFPLPRTDEGKHCFGPFCSRAFSGSQSLRLYSDAGPGSVLVNFEIAFVRPGHGDNRLTAESAISGYLVDLNR